MAHSVAAFLKASPTATATLSIPEHIPPFTSTLSSSTPSPTFIIPPVMPHPVSPWDATGLFGPIVSLVGFIIFALSTLAFIGFMYRVPKHSRVFHWLLVLTSVICAMTYYAMTTGLGYVSKEYVVVGHGLAVRQIYVAQWVEWFLTSPLVLLALSFLSGLSIVDTGLVILANFGLSATWIVGAVGYGRKYPRLNYRIGFFVFAGLFWLWIAYLLIWEGGKAAFARSAKVGHLYSVLLTWTLLVSLGYPIIIGLGEYAGIISVKSEMLVFMILDVLSKAAFGAGLITGLRLYAEADVQISDALVLPRGRIYLPVEEDEA